MLKMYGFWRSAATFRVRAALNLEGLAFEEAMVDLDAGEQNTPAFRGINPEPALLPVDPRGKARIRALALIFAADHHPLIVPRVRRYLADAFEIDNAGRTVGEALAPRGPGAGGGALGRRPCDGAVLPWRRAEHRRSLPDEPGVRRAGLQGPDRRSADH